MTQTKPKPSMAELLPFGFGLVLALVVYGLGYMNGRAVALLELSVAIPPAIKEEFDRRGIVCTAPDKPAQGAKK